MFLARNALRHEKFFTEENSWRYLPPFLIITKKLAADAEPPNQLSFGKCNIYEGIPHTSELLTIYEDFHHSRYPMKEICVLAKKYFVVQYTPGLIHAIDGLGSGLIMMPVNGNLIFKLYSSDEDESYDSCVMPLAELRDLMDTEIRTW